ncbi:MAG TPA: hypothetical protein V6C91_08450 [Coleofasciculaceae cyanobacterium]
MTATEVWHQTLLAALYWAVSVGNSYAEIPASQGLDFSLFQVVTSKKIPL